MKNCADGNFEVGSLQEPISLEQLPLAEQPHALDSSALQPTIGGGFHPGIEFPYLILYREYFPEAFRVGKDNEPRSEEHRPELKSLIRISNAVLCMKRKPHYTRSPSRRPPSA